MGELLGIGCTHAPHLQFPDENMNDRLRHYLESDRTPAELRDPRNWPAGMREEWGDDAGLTSARKHREELVRGFRAARAALDAFNPDFIVIFGDDQYENFREDVLPPFCVYALDSVDVEPFKPSAVMDSGANVWNAPTDTVVTVRGHREGGVALASELVTRGFDVACAFKLHHAKSLNHAFVRTLLYLDYDRQGIDYPIVPFHVNCYGSHLRIGREKREAGIDPPPSPPPWRCYDLGREVARILEDSPWRVAVIGSSSWSHASLTEKHYFIYPDLDADSQRLAELRAGELRKWRDLSPEQIVDSGQHEILNWVCLAGAMEGRTPDVLAYSPTYLFNSSKAVALFPARERVGSAV